MKKHFKKLLLVTVLVLLQQTAFAADASKKIPIPEYYGTYAVVNGKLLAISDGGPSTLTPKQVEIKLGEITPYFRARFGEPLSNVEPANVPQLSADVQFIVYNESATTIAKDLRLFNLFYVRNFSLNSADPLDNNLRFNGSAFAWVDLSGGEEEWTKPMRFLAKPVTGQSNMVIAVPDSKLQPGVYLLKSFLWHFYFVVGDPQKVENRRCIDLSVMTAPGRTAYSFSECNKSQTGSPQNADTKAKRQAAFEIAKKNAVYMTDIGKAVYDREGCGDCHAMTPAPWEENPPRKSPLTLDGGTMEPGTWAPPLLYIGSRMPSYEWHVQHLIAPKTVSGNRSTMPAYDHLLGALAAKLGKTPEQRAQQTMNNLGDNPAYLENTELDALVQYLLSLKGW